MLLNNQMTFLLKNDIELERDHTRDAQAIKIWLALTITGAMFITLFSDWNAVGTGNVFSLYTACLGLIIQTLNSIVSIWKS